MKDIRPDLIERVYEVVNDAGLSVNAFAKKADLDQGGMRKKLAGKEGFTAGNIRKIASAFGVNRKWLDTGEGAMYSVPHYNMGGITNIGSHVDNAVQTVIGAKGEGSAFDRVSDIIGGALSKDMQIAMLKEEVASLRQQNKLLMQMLSNNK